MLVCLWSDEELFLGSPGSDLQSAQGLARALGSAIHDGDDPLPVSSSSLSEVRARLCGVAVCAFVCTA